MWYDDVTIQSPSAYNCDGWGTDCPPSFGTSGPSFTLNVTKTGTGTGVVSGGGAYPVGTPVTLTAQANANSTFIGWSGDCTGTAPCALTMDADKNVGAQFNLTGVPPPTGSALNLRFATTSSPGCPGGAGTCVAVDLSTNTGAVNYNYSGVHLGGLGLSPSYPDSLVTPLKLQLVSDLNAYNRMRPSDASTTIIEWSVGWTFNDWNVMCGAPPGTPGTWMSDGHCERFSNTPFATCTPSGFPPNSGHQCSFAAGAVWDPFANFAALRLNSILATVRPSDLGNIHIEVWNEPFNNAHNEPCLGTTCAAQSQSDFNEMWRRAVQQTRAAIPNATITGPALAWYNFQRFQDLLLFCKTATPQCVPDVVSWHEIGPPVENGGGDLPYVGAENFAQRVQDVRNFLTTNQIFPVKTPGVIPKIQIDEYLFITHLLEPGAMVASIANLQRNGIYRAAWTTWTDTDINGNPVDPKFTLNSMLVYNPSGPSWQPRASWWAVKAYADMTGNYGALTAANGFDGLVSISGSEIRAVIGNVGGSSGTDVRFAGISALTANSSVHVTVSRIQNTGSAVSGGPAAVINNQSFPVSNNAIVVPISSSSLGDVHIITVTP